MPKNPFEQIALKCADCARSDSAVTDLLPSSRVEVPAEALLGFPGGVPRPRRGVNRRAFLRGGAVGMASIYSLTHMSWESVWDAASANAATPMQKSVVCIYLNGGNDGVNTIVPIGSDQYGAYHAARANIARGLGPSVTGTAGTTAMPGTGGSLGFANPTVSGTGNNGDTRGFDTLYGDGSGGSGSDLAVFPATDYTPSDLSHFDSRDYWFAGELEQAQTGWLGRWLDTYGSSSNPLQAISLDASLSKQIRTASAPVCAITGLTGAAFRVPGAASDSNPAVAALAAVPADAANVALTRARATYGETVQVSSQLTGVTAGPVSAGYPANSDLSTNLQLAATLLGAGLGTRVVTIDWGSFDTHGNEISTQDPQLSVLSRALAAFKADLIARGIEQNVVTLVFSEFGRRIDSNDSAGTDHGAGGLVLVSGSAVKGGLAGEHPGVTQDDGEGNLKVVTDFRSVYQAMIAEWLGGDPTAVLPGGPFPGIARYDGGTTLMK